jgi:hypothetical protein
MTASEHGCGEVRVVSSIRRFAAFDTESRKRVSILVRESETAATTW